jgi:hypothetical protein
MHTTTRRYLTLLFCLALLVPLASLMVGALEPAQAATATIHGTVRLNDGGDGGPGTRLANIKVIFWRRDGGNTIEKWTGPDGYFSSGRVDDAGFGFNVAFNKPDTQNPVPGQPGLNPEYTYEETYDVYLSNPQGGYVVVNKNLNPVSGSNPNPNPGPSSGPTSDLFGLAINANRDTQNPPDSELSALGVRWVRTIKYTNQEISPHGNVNWLVIFNQESFPDGMPRSGESWNDYSNRFANAAQELVKNRPWIKAIQIWNEPDSTQEGVGPHLSEQQYAVLLRTTYLKLKELPNPPIVVSAGLCTGAGSGANYIQKVRSYWGGQIYYDAVGFHPYMAKCDGVGWGDSITDSINTLYAKTGGKQLWLTEFGGPVEAFNNNEDTQAAYLDCLYRTIPSVKDGSKPKVGVAFWFAWDDRTHYDPVNRHFGLVRQNWQQNYPDNPSAYRRPAWYKYQARARASSSTPTVAFTDGMEGGTGAWKSYLATFSSSIDARHAGSSSLKAVGNGPAYNVKGGQTVSGGVYLKNFAAVSPNTKYEVSAWVYNPSTTGVQANLYVQQYRGTDPASKVRDTNDAFIHDEYSVKPLVRGNGWQKVTVTFTTHKEANYLNPSLCTRETGRTVYWDDVQIKKV